MKRIVHLFVLSSALALTACGNPEGDVGDAPAAEAQRAALRPNTLYAQCVNAALALYGRQIDECFDDNRWDYACADQALDFYQQNLEFCRWMYLA